MSASKSGGAVVGAGARAAAPPRRGLGRQATPYLFLLPALIILAVTIVYPIFFNLNLSTLEVRTISRTAGEFVGLRNYGFLISDDDFWNSLRVSLTFTFLSVPIAFVLGFAIALVMNEIGRGRPVFLVLLLIPWIISPVVTGYAWRWLFNDQFGLVNEFLLRAGLIREPVTWLAMPTTAMAAVIVAGVWRFVPYMMVMMLAGLQAIPQELYEAAEVDGANAWNRFLSITVPQLRYIIGVVILFAIIWTFNDFSLPYIMTQGGPAKATTVLPIQVYRIAFEALRLGRGAALAMIILIILLFFSTFYIRRLLREEEAR